MEDLECLSMMRYRVKSLVSDELWTIIEPLLPPEPAKPKGGRARVSHRAQVEDLPATTGDTVELAYVEQGYTGADAEAAAAGRSIRLEVVKLPEARKDVVPLPRRWVVERSFAWLTRFRRLAKDYERLEDTVVGLHLVALY